MATDAREDGYDRDHVCGEILRGWLAKCVVRKKKRGAWRTAFGGGVGTMPDPGLGLRAEVHRRRLAEQRDDADGGGEPPLQLRDPQPTHVDAALGPRDGLGGSVRGVRVLIQPFWGRTALVGAFPGTFLPFFESFPTHPSLRGFDL